MGSMDSAFGGNFEGGFEPDDFYESFLAPKFHDFTAPEEPIDPDAYFMAKPGMLKKAFATVEDVKPAAPKIHKAAPQEAPKTVTAQAPPKSPVAAEKTASSTGSAKKATRVIATAVTPLASKPLKNGNSSPAHPSMQEKQNNSNNGSLKPTSLAKKLQASENDDPNSPANNNSPDAAAPKPSKQRSTKAPEEKPALTRQRSQKILETKPERKTSVESNISKESGVKKTSAKTPVKEAKPCAEAAGSGHYCKSSRCAANDPNLASPVPTKKYLVAKLGTPGSLKKTISEKSEKSESATESVKAKVALEDVFQRMDLEPKEKKQELSKSGVEDLKEVQELSKSEVEDLKEVPLEEEKKVISGDEIRAWVGRSVNFEEKEVSSVSEATEKLVKEEKGADGIETFLKVASECLENVDLGTLEVPQISKHGKKRKSGELNPAGSSKRANCTSDETRNKAISKKISQVKEAAASKIPNKLKMRRLSVAKRLSIARPGSRVTNPRPFRLRTQERGAVKEKEFIKKAEEYRAAKDGFHSAFQGLAVAESKIPGKFSKSAHVFSAKRAEPLTQDHEKEGEAIKVMKAGIPPSHRAPLFDHPFKPHRSTKKLTVPQEPKFHTTRVDLLTRVNGIIKKYEKYDTEKAKEGPPVAGHDHFLKLYVTIEDDLRDILKKVEEAEKERNRAVIATLNAEIRRSKAALRLEMPKLHKLATKKVKGVKGEELLKRPAMALALEAKIEEVADGASAIRRKSPVKGQPLEIRIDNYSPEDIMRSGATKEHSTESKAFCEEYEVRKKKQDEGLEAIQQGLSTLKDMAHDIGEELNRQDQLVDEADTKTDQANINMKTTNSRLKESVTAMRSSRNFCIDITLLVIILGIAAYLYKALKK